MSRQEPPFRSRRAGRRERAIDSPELIGPVALVRCSVQVFAGPGLLEEAPHNARNLEERILNALSDEESRSRLEEQIRTAVFDASGGELQAETIVIRAG